MSKLIPPNQQFRLKVSVEAEPVLSEDKVKEESEPAKRPSKATCLCGTCYKCKNRAWVQAWRKRQK